MQAECKVDEVLPDRPRAVSAVDIAADYSATNKGVWEYSATTIVPASGGAGRRNGATFGMDMKTLPKSMLYWTSIGQTDRV